MFRITPKEEAFFEMFADSVKISGKAAEMLRNLMTNYVNIGTKIRAIEEVEHECDNHVHKILAQLNKSFITPIDREDIFLIAKEIDNITDSIEATAHRFSMFNVTEIREDAIKLAELIVECTKELETLMRDLKTMKKNKSLQERIIYINKLEDDGDTIYRTAIAKLFISEGDGIEVIKWKEIYEFLENTLDACEDVANIVEGVVMKHA